MKRIAIAVASFLTTIAAYAAYVGVMADTTTGTVAIPALEARIAKWTAITDHPTTLSGYGILDAPTWQQMIDYVVANTTPIGATNEPAFIGWTNQWHVPITTHLAITNGNPHGVTAGMLGAVVTNDNTYTSTVDKAATAYSWGDHSAAGYLTGFTETDSIFTASAAYGITTNLIAYWNTAFSWGDHSTQGYLKVESEPLWNAWVTNSEPGSTNAVLPDGSLVDIGPLIGQVSGGSSSVTGLTINIGTENNLTPTHSYVFGTRCGSTGENAVAMGYRASAIHSNVFVWSDQSSETAFSDFGINTFNVRATGGIYLYTSNLYLSSFDGTNRINRKVPTSNDVVNISSNFNTSTFIPYTLSSELASDILWKFNTNSGPEYLTHVNGDIADRWINFKTGQIEGFQVLKDGTNIVSLSIDAYNNSIRAIRIDTGTTYNVDTECFNIRSGGVFRVWNQGNAEFQANLTSEYIPWLMLESYAGFTFISHNSASSDDELWVTKYYPQENTSSNVLATIHANLKSSSIQLEGTNIADIAGQITTNVVQTGTIYPYQISSATNIQLLATNNPVKELHLTNVAASVIWMPTKTNVDNLIFGTLTLFCYTSQVTFTNGSLGLDITGVTSLSTTTNNFIKYYSSPGTWKYVIQSLTP